MPTFPSFVRTQSFWISSAQGYHLNLIIYKDTISKQGPVHRCWELGSLHLLGDGIQPIIPIFTANWNNQTDFKKYLWSDLEALPITAEELAQLIGNLDRAHSHQLFWDGTSLLRALGCGCSFWLNSIPHFSPLENSSLLGLAATSVLASHIPWPIQ